LVTALSLIFLFERARHSLFEHTTTTGPVDKMMSESNMIVINNAIANAIARNNVSMNGK
jgi:hypothetical protein